MAGKTAVLSLKIIGDATGAQKAAATTKKEVDGLEKSLAAAGPGIENASNLIGLAAGGGLALGFASAISADSANRQLAASMGLNPAEQEAAGKIAGSLYANAYGGSLEEVNATIGGVASTLADLGTNGGADVERLSKKALDLAAAFPEVGDGVSTAGILMKTGLAKDGDEAFDLLAGSLQKVPKAMQGELLPVMDEYSKHFADLGIDGTTAFGIMANAAEGGAIQMDKTGDALKEFTIRATDGSKATADAYKSIGLNAEDMARKIAAGGPEAQDAFAKTVAGLQSIEDPAAQAQAAIGLFGTPLEDLGTAKIPEFLGAIDPAGDSFDSLAGKADAMGQTLNSGPGVALETLKRTAEQSFSGLLAAAMPVLMPIIGWLQQFAPILAPIALAIGAVAAAQAIWNAALALNPIGIVIIAIAALAAGVIWAYNNVGWFKDAVDAAGAVAVAVFNGIVAWIQSVIQWLNEALAPVGGIQGALDLMGAAAATMWEGFIGWIQDAIKWLDDTLAPVGGIEGALRTMGDVGKAALDGLVAGLSTVIGWVKDAISWFASLFAEKSKSDGAGGGMGLALDGGGGTPPPASFGAPGPAGGPAPGSFGASFGAASSSLAPAVQNAAAGSMTNVSIKVEVKADATTDKVALGRELLHSINKALGATGQPKLAIV